jgi:uncharacterized protein (TIGR02145 family)
LPSKCDPRTQKHGRTTLFYHHARLQGHIAALFYLPARVRGHIAALFYLPARLQGHIAALFCLPAGLQATISPQNKGVLPMKINKISPSMVLAMVFIFSCSDENGGSEEKYSYCIKDEFCHEGPYTLDACSSFGGMPSNNCPNGGGGGSSSSIVDGQGSSSSFSSEQGVSSSDTPPSSSSVVPSSSSLAPSSSSLSHIGKGNNISNYRTIAIGTQTWMAENLDYVVAGSKCYNNDPSRCNEYGSLYDWSTAMALPLSCNTNSCANQIQSPHRGICPSGWHIPSQSDWNTLSSYVQSTSGCSSCDAKLLKSTSGWSDGDNGTDQYGFSALPGGNGYSDGSFSYVGGSGFWWSASEYNAYDAYFRVMYYDLSNVYRDGLKSRLYSVRCLQD